MLYTIPDYYQNFKCTADECEDTCCAGWQIAIDRKSLVRYGKVTGKFRRRLNRSIRWLEGTFKQGEGGRCAFLNEENLCDLYSALGKESLCRTCRLYLINQGIVQLTKDHSLVEEMVRLGGIKPEEAKHHPDKNIITRAIGAKDSVEVDFYEHRLKKGDIILMCTDGLSNMVEDEELFHIVQGGRDIVESAQSLVETAKENGGTDNIGIVLVEPFADEVSIC